MKSKSTQDFFTKVINRSKEWLQQWFSFEIPLFFSQVLKHPLDIGAFAPSSKKLAEVITKYVPDSVTEGEPKRILEVGAGTGPFTKLLINKLPPNSTLDVVEKNPLFYKHLKNKYAKNKNVHIHLSSILDWKPDYSYDVVISSLPFNAFNPHVVEDILNHYQKISQHGAYLSYVEYLLLPRVRRLFLSKKKKLILEETKHVTSQFEEKFEIIQENVFANFPPAKVHHCQLD